MLVDGAWSLFDDGVARPVILGEIRSAGGPWIKVPFLVDTGADRTVFTAVALAESELVAVGENAGICGLGGPANSVVVETEIRLTYEARGKVVFSSRFAAVTELEALDISVLGRDITGLFTVIVDGPGDTVCLVGQRHRYQIKRD